MRFDVITVLPDMFPPVLGVSVLGRAIAAGAAEVHVHDLRDWTSDRHRTTDDAPFGGGPGMVMKPEPVYAAVRALQDGHSPSTVVLFTPQGQPLTDALVRELAAEPRLLLICGRYEGFDERIRLLADREVSLGDFVLTGGEIPAMALIDAVTRLQPGALGDDESARDESFANGLLEYPQYTRPAEFEGLAVPTVLTSGDHARIAQWRRTEAIRRTALRRPDLLAGADLTDDERAFAERVLDERE